MLHLQKINLNQVIKYKNSILIMESIIQISIIEA